MKYRKQAQSVYYTRYHIVFVTKYRRKALNEGLGAFCVGILRRICQNYPDLELYEAKCDEDHIHFLISIPPKWSVSDAVNILKSNSSRAMRRKFPFLEQLYDRHVGFWSDGYFVSTAGVNEEQIKKYIKLQGEEDNGQAKLEI
ncbi:MAG: IS200/IS605 family transposase [Candidatus Buchananbacteria bacterium]|nr:IS200/IS605 family transposase [Candidatus Buchananbacteria bacterium]